MFRVCVCLLCVFAFLIGGHVFQVDSRSTARIPIVIFKDDISGLECDISVMNPLAVRNTRLLKVTTPPQGGGDVLQALRRVRGG